MQAQIVHFFTMNNLIILDVLQLHNYNYRTIHNRAPRYVSLSMGL